MTKSYSPFIAGLAFAAIYFAGCSDNKPAESTTPSTAAEKPSYGGYETQVKWGEHLVAIGGCNDCHTPKKMTAMGPVDDSTLMLSGHPEQLPAVGVVTLGHTGRRLLNGPADMVCCWTPFVVIEPTCESMFCRPLYRPKLARKTDRPLLPISQAKPTRGWNMLLSLGNVPSDGNRESFRKIPYAVCSGGTTGSGNI